MNAAGLWLVVAGLSISALPAAYAQTGAPFAAEPSPAASSHEPKERPLPDRLPDKPSIPPVLSVPVEPLGFSAPGPIYLGQRNSLASLDFLDENRLLFTFRVPGLMHREAGDNGEGGERQIRALVLALPAGTVQAEALWTVHDRARYLWMLNGGHFLLRDRESLLEGDATLELKPKLEFPGPLLRLDFDPTEQYLVANSREPATAVAKAGNVASPATAAASVTVDGEKPAIQPDLVVRILKWDSGKVMLVSRVRSTVHLPVNSDGYLEVLRGNGRQWTLNLNYFSGGSTILAHLQSACSPTPEFVSQREILVAACGSGGGGALLAMDTGGRLLWEDVTSGASVWPLLVMGPGGSRLARETLAVTHTVDAIAPLDSADVKGQLVRVFDAATGNVALEAPASPALDAGGNVAISPSGRRVAVLNAGAIQVFDLPPPPSLPDPPVHP